MATSFATTHGADARIERRDDVHYRARGTAPDGRTLPLLIVNISAGGLMIRYDLDISVGDRLGVTLPVIGRVEAEVRWALGGRLERTIGPAHYYELLAAMAPRR